MSPEGEDFHELVTVIDGAVVEVIEAKKRLNIDVIGQVLAGTTMLSEAHPGHGPMLATAVVQDASDEALRWFCNRERIAILETGADWGAHQKSPS